MQRIKTIRIQNFKAFKEAISLDLDGKNALIYGNNGSGKSSLFWALYTFLQSSTKQDADLQKYFAVFDPNNEKTFQSLRNVFSSDTEGVVLSLTLADEEGIEAAFEIGTNLINTNKTNTSIKEANIGSDFINYKLLHNFYNGTHRQEINLWNVFRRDIFPYFAYDSTRSFKDVIDNLYNEIPRKRGGDLSRRSSDRRTNFDNRINDINTKVEGFIKKIEENGNDFLKKHFLGGKDLIRFNLKYSKKINFEHINNNQIDERHLHIKLWIELFDEKNDRWVENHRPHSFLNEAQLTRIAIAIRIGALQTRVTSTDLRLLVLDDMLISLDMSNRMQVVDMLLNKANKPELRFFEGFQKIILTHDKAFFNLIKRDTSPLHWKYYELDRKEMSNESPKITPNKEYIEKALDYLNNRDFDGCAIMLRKELEALLKRKLGKHIPATATKLEDKEHKALSDMLNQVKTRFDNENQTHLKKFLNMEHDANLLAKLNTDFHNDPNIEAADKGKLKSFQMAMIKAFKERNEENSEIEELLKDAQKYIDFVLNQGAHDTNLPSFESELRAAYNTIKKLSKYWSN